MATMKVMIGTEDCCSKSGNMEGVCHKPPIEKENKKEQHCPQPKTESTCICICCFQFAAPDQLLVKFDASNPLLLTNYNTIPDQRWIDPFLAGPWQPPDID